MSTDLGKRLRDLRKERGLSQEAVARRADIGLRAYGDLERGRALDPHYSTLEGLAHALGTTVAELVGEVESAPKVSAPSPGPPSEASEAAGPQDDEQAATSRFLTLDADLLRTICESMAAHYENLAGRDVPPSRALGWWDVAPYDAGFVLAVVDVLLEGVKDGSIIDDENEIIPLLRAAYRLAHFADALWSKSVGALGEEIERASVEMRFWQATEHVELTEEQKESIVS